MATLANPVDALLAAVEAMSIRPPNRHRQTLPLLARGVILDWVKDLARTLDRGQRALQTATQQPMTDDGQAALEECLWRVGAAREKLKAILCLCFAVPTVHPWKAKGASYPRGVRFWVEWSDLEARLIKLSEVHQVARDVLRMLDELQDHPGLTLRNEISHMLAPIQGAPVLAAFDLVECEDGKIIAQTPRYIWSENMSAREDIKKETLWKFSVGAVSGALKLLVDALARTAELIRDAAQLEPAQFVYLDAKTGRVST